MSKTDYGETITKLECEYDIRAVESLVSGLYYLQDDKRKSIGIMTIRNGRESRVLLSKKQAYALIDEFKDICDLYFE
jgi:hypothetical protein